jgi:hypothetical protein
MRWDPLHDLVAWHTRAQGRVPDAHGWTPPVDVYETADSYTVIVELAGFTSSPGNGRLKAAPVSSSTSSADTARSRASSNSRSRSLCAK